MPLTAALFLSVYILLAASSVFYHPIFGVLGYVYVYLGFSRNSWWGSVLYSYCSDYSLIMAACIAVGFVLHQQKLQGTHGTMSHRGKLFVFFIMILCVSLMFAPAISPDSWYTFTKMLKVFVFVFLFSKIVDRLDFYHWLIVCFAVLGLMLGYYAYTAPPWMFTTGRLNLLGNADFSNSNTLGNLFLVLLCLSGVQIFQRRRFLEKAVYAVASTFLCNGIVLCRSRGVFLSAILTGATSVLFAPKKIRGKLIVGALAGTLMFFTLVDPAFMARMSTIDNYEQDTSSTSRLAIWKASAEMLLDHPFGVGIGNFKYFIGNYDPQVARRDSHNTFVRCYGELGVLGLIAFLSLYVSSFYQLARIRREVTGHDIEYEISLYCMSLFYALVASLLAGMFSTVLYIEFFWWLLILPSCLEVAVHHQLYQSETAIEQSKHLVKPIFEQENWGSESISQ